MGTVMDLIIAALITGMLLISVMNMNVNLTSAGTNTNMQAIIQGNATTAASVVANDFYKIGYRASPAIIYASPSDIRFCAQMEQNGRVDTIHYWTTALSDSGANPNLRILYRTENGLPLAGSSLGETSFNLAYYDSLGNAINTAGVENDPATLNLIKTVSVEIFFQSSTKFLSSQMADTGYAGIYWKALVSPKNLRTLM